jgi:hypothetical protein
MDSFWGRELLSRRRVLTATPTLRLSMAPQPDLQGLSAREVEQARGSLCDLPNPTKGYGFILPDTGDKDAGQGVRTWHRLRAHFPPLRKRA